VKTHTDLFKKKQHQTYQALDLVESFDFRTNQWTVFDAKLCIPRYSAAIQELKGYLYVIGGHKIELPNEFINSVERCPTRAL